MIKFSVFCISYKIGLLFVYVLIWSTYLGTLLDGNKILMLDEI